MHVLVYLVGLVLVCGESPIDRIFNKHWERLQSSDLHLVTTQEEKDSLSSVAITTAPRHECAHADLMEYSGARALRYSEAARLKAWYNWNHNIPITLQESKKRSLQNATSPAPAPSTPIPPPPPTSNWGKIRVYAETQWISSSDTYSCSSAGQVVTLDQSYTTSSGTTTNQYTCQTSDVLTPAKISMLKNYVIPALLETINNLLQVISETGNLVLDSQYHSTYGMNCRSNLAIPSSLLSSGVPSSDYYLMVTARPIANPNVLANALPCSHRIQPGNRFSRPLAGSINFNPGAAALLYSPNKPFLFNQILKTALHEMTHALGFTNDLFSDYLTPDGGYYAAGVTTTANYKGETKYLINTPRVVSYAQTHYGCSSLTGMELEDQGSNGAPGSHWESRLVDSEYMAGVSSPDSQVSALTLNFFEDMGWYTSNFSMVEEFDYGRGEGCAWATQPCSSATWNRYWCQSNSAADKCNGHRTAVGRCNYAQYTAALPSQYQYFSDPAVGGSNNWPDYCPVYQGYSNTYCHDPDGLVGSTQYGQTYSNISRCWDFVSPASSGCYPTLCGVLPGNTDVTVQVLISGSWRTCPVGGGNLDVSTSSGTVTVLCPKVEFFCSAAGKVNFTFNSNNNIPIPNAPTAPGTRTIPGLPDLPFLPPLPQIFPPSWNFNLTTIGDPWTWTIGSIPFYIVVIGGCLLLFLILLCCCCKK